MRPSVYHVSIPLSFGFQCYPTDEVFYVLRITGKSDVKSHHFAPPIITAQKGAKDLNSLAAVRFEWALRCQVFLEREMCERVSGSGRVSFISATVIKAALRRTLHRCSRRVAFTVRKFGKVRVTVICNPIQTGGLSFQSANWVLKVAQPGLRIESGCGTSTLANDQDDYGSRSQFVMKFVPS
jgi:hypothetical protein